MKRKLKNVQELGNDVPSKPLLFMKVRLCHLKFVVTFYSGSVAHSSIY
jgi:hypothetical protein